MPHYAMCRDQGCERRMVCRRYLARPRFRQDYFDGSPRPDGHPHCEYLEPATRREADLMRTVEEVDEQVIELEVA